MSFPSFPREAQVFRKVSYDGGDSPSFGMVGTRGVAVAHRGDRLAYAFDMHSTVSLVSVDATHVSCIPRVK